jgi:bacterial/archaeal transporter family-2 protein
MKGERKMIWLLALIAVAAGALLPIQASINGRMRPFVGGPIPATLVSVTVSTLTMIVLVIATRTSVPSSAKLSGSPWWVWTGGLLGVVFVLVSLGLINRLGAAFLFALVVVGQMLASLAIDHFGLFGVSEHAVSPLRVMGVVLLFGGVLLIRLF